MTKLQIQQWNVAALFALAESRCDPWCVWCRRLEPVYLEAANSVRRCRPGRRPHHVALEPRSRPCGAGAHPPLPWTCEAGSGAHACARQAGRGGVCGRRSSVMAAQLVRELAILTSAACAQVDCVEHQQFCAKNMIRAYPTLRMYKDVRPRIHAAAARCGSSPC